MASVVIFWVALFAHGAALVPCSAPAADHGAYKKCASALPFCIQVATVSEQADDLIDNDGGDNDLPHLSTQSIILPELRTLPVTRFFGNTIAQWRVLRLCERGPPGNVISPARSRLSSRPCFVRCSNTARPSADVHPSERISRL